VSERWCAVILAAGEGTRMNSEIPKVLHQLAGRPMVEHVMRAVQGLVGQTALVVSPRTEAPLRALLGESLAYAVQTPMLGTAHALQQARQAAGEATDLLVVNGDAALLEAETLRALQQAHLAADANVTFLSTKKAEPGRRGRVLRGASGQPVAVVEALAGNEEVLAIQEVNLGVYAFRAPWVWDALQRVEKSAVGEYYITSLIELAIADGGTVEVVQTEDDLVGIKDRVDLARTEGLLRQRVRERVMCAGATLLDPATTYIDDTVTVGRDTVIEPGCHLKGTTTIGANCLIGPNSMLTNATVGDRCTVVASSIADSTLEADVDVGPFARLRAGAHIEQGCHIGNYAEIKNSRLGRGVKMGHFSYLGDADVGEGTNIGAGTITANYDGVNKNRTRIGRRVFVGSDTMLVAPVELGDDSRTGVGSVVTRDVPGGVLVAGVPARPVPRQAQGFPDTGGDVPSGR
jgi:bifunctional UDP-N-acetylglucosamine pyrophosphorylase/glucosamine-1-phosphate N-acetyltransferase